MEHEIKDTQRLLVGSGALLLLFAGLAGFGFLFFLLGKIELWPFLYIEYQMPGSLKAWRMTHLEGVINGLIQWIFALMLPLLPFAAKTLRRMSLGFISIGWLFTVASLFDAIFPNSRGLAFGGEITNTIAFLMFYFGILVLIVILIAIAWRTLVGGRGGRG
ncbi:hypothetical protein DFR24_0389 [Panacagrimonas perspica]|uniref:Styrene-oxide isomerase n=1 Tax=Panacagrimonas perspica TaxID=381431 RepID=A0A4S3K1K6_9GAMM|nr:hypothetical protein [Panacagrimonas perspica]TDU31031.1 hypothetical protein DFR24_0389 [Panacagrimonas perspica]THD01823.1 hypothetical protein B1810_17625 [Panacagrimonas perspica]